MATLQALGGTAGDEYSAAVAIRRSKALLGELIGDEAILKVLRSDDLGATWQEVARGYTRAILVPAGQPDTLIASPGPKVGQQGTIRITRDAGATWTEIADGIETPMPDQVEVFHADPAGTVWGVCAGGRLLRATAGEWHWRSLPAFEGELNAQSIAFAG